MYKISVPVINNKLYGNPEEREKVLSALKKTSAQRVFLSIGQHIIDPEERKTEFAMLKDNCGFLKSNGFEVGVWLWTFLSDSETPYTKITGANGQETSANCPMDRDFVAFMQQYIADLGKCGVDLILFDDDFRFGHQSGSISCTCKLHMARIKELLKEDISPEELKDKALTGGANAYRDAWMQANGESLMQFAASMREALDRETPGVRMGFCSCMSSWGNDGIHPEALAKALAGNTRPFMRLIGAPYWAVDRGYDDSRLQNIIEFERMQRSWCVGGIELFGEGDVYPRPRNHCPAAYLELFDMALRADGTLDGILKYVLDYHASADYETGYVDLHCKNRALYAWIEAYLAPKTACGVRVYEVLDKLKTMRLPEAAKQGAAVDGVMFSPAAKMLADCAIPTVYDGAGVCGAAFDENIRSVPADALKNGIIIDMRAAEILEGMGIDTGLAHKGEWVRTETEFFDAYNQHIHIPGGIMAYKTRLKSACQVLSHFIINKKTALDPGEKIPAAFFYENNNGHKFLVFTFDAYFGNGNIYRSYARSRQLADSIRRFSGKRLPAYSYGNPDLYIMAKKKGGAMAVGLWNMFPDPVLKPVIELDGAYGAASFINCTGELKGDKLYLSEIQPYAFAGIEVNQ